MAASPPSLFALSASVVARHDLLDEVSTRLNDEVGQRAASAARHLNCVSPHCKHDPGELACGLCLLPFCNLCGTDALVCGGCNATVCRLCAATDEEGHAMHHKLWDGQPRRPHLVDPPPPSSCHMIDCKTCGKLLCWYCWQAISVDHDGENAGWMCDVCHSSLCFDCIIVVDAVEGLPKIAHCFEDVDVNVVCHGCLSSDPDKYELTAGYNPNYTALPSFESYESEMLRCTACGEWSSAELIFCPSCGH